MRVLFTHWHFYVFGIFCCSISHSTSHAPIFYAKKMIARRLRRFFEVNLFYSLCSGREKAPPRRVGQRGEASPVGGPLWFIAGLLMLASIGSMPTRTQPSKKRAPFPRRALTAYHQSRRPPAPSCRVRGEIARLNYLGIKSATYPLRYKTKKQFRLKQQKRLQQ